jgi:hypothetical protein
MVLLLHQFDADVVRSRDVAESFAVDALFQWYREFDIFCFKAFAKLSQVANVHKTKMICAPLVVAGIITEGLDWIGWVEIRWGLLRAGCRG